MIDLTSRQVQILRAVVEEYINTAEAVGSDTIDRKFSLGVSPATIRNEMVYLTKHGYLKQPHTSAGRVPTSLAMKVYVRDLMRERDLSVAEEVTLKERIWQQRSHLNSSALKALFLRLSVKNLRRAGFNLGASKFFI
jgi:heat-inducible transcriptional repressor